MSIGDLKPDTPKEWAAIGSAIARLGSAASGVLLFEADKYWVVGSLLLTWAGHELHAYMKLHDKSIDDSDPS